VHDRLVLVFLDSTAGVRRSYLPSLYSQYLYK